MNAAVLHAPGAPRFGAFEPPAARPRHAVVDVAAAGVNPVDLLIADGILPDLRPSFPSVSGREGVGRLADGRRVYFMEPAAPYGAMAERALVAEDDLFDVPDGVDDALAVALGISGFAAWLPLAWCARLEPGETVLVLGATGSVGCLAVQAAKLLGAGRVIAAGRSAAGLERALAHGADAIVRLDAEDLPAALADAAGGPVDVIVDALWGPFAAAAHHVAAHGARHVQIGHAGGREATLPAVPIRARGITLIGHSNFDVPHAVRQDTYHSLLEHAHAGRLALDVEVLPLRDVAHAWERQRGGPGAKLVLVP